jgi:hypothetical protein
VRSYPQQRVSRIPKLASKSLRIYNLCPPSRGKLVGGRLADTLSLTVLLPAAYAIYDVLMVAIQQAKWAKYGVVTGYDRIVFWALCVLYTVAGLGHANVGIILPQVAFFSNVAAMIASRMLKAQGY